MILVTVGTHNEGFNRLVQAMDELAAELDERVVIQRGTSTYTPRHAEQFQWTTGPEMEHLTAEARVVVTHAAAGSILLGLRKGKPLVVVPRLHRFGEHMDDHQQDLAVGLSARGQAVAVQEITPANLHAAIIAATQQQVQLEGPGRLIQSVRDQLQRWSSPHSTAIEHARKNI